MRDWVYEGINLFFTNEPIGLRHTENDMSNLLYETESLLMPTREGLQQQSRSWFNIILAASAEQFTTVDSRDGGT